MSKVKKFYGRHNELVDPYNVAVSKLISDLMALEAYIVRLSNTRFIFADLVHGCIDKAGVL